MKTISVIITGHREGVLAGPSIASAFEAAEAAVAAGAEVEIVAVLDRPDPVTRAMFEGVSRKMKIYESDFGDPGLARNLGVEMSANAFIAFLDADDLWSHNWLSAAAEFCDQHDDSKMVAHSEVNFTFGSNQALWWHADSTAPGFDLGYMRVGNYWDALTFGSRDIYLAHPFEQNALALGYGHEDWHWNCVTLAAGIAHRPVPGTVHFKRRREGSQMSRCEESDVVVRPNPLSRFSVVGPEMNDTAGSRPETVAAGETLQ